VYSLGDHAIVFALDEMIDSYIVNEITRLTDFIKTKELPGIKDIIPSYHTLTIVYDLIYFTNNSTNVTDQLVDLSNKILTEFELIPSSKIKVYKDTIEVPVCYEMPFALDIENLCSKNNISIKEMIEIHTSKIYEVYSIGFLPGFAYMGTVDKRIQTTRHEKPRLQVVAGSVGIAGLQTGIYPTNSPGGWQIIGRTPWIIFDPNPEKLTKFNVGDQIQFYTISEKEFDNLNEHK
jgi:inhibitor of KinA